MNPVSQASVAWPICLYPHGGRAGLARPWGFSGLLAHPRNKTLLAISVILALLGCAAGGQLHDSGMRMLAEGDREAGLTQLREAARIDPTNAQFRIDLLREQMMYARELLERADEARRNGQGDVANALYLQVQRIQPGNERAARGISVLQMDTRHAALIVKAERELKDGALDDARATLKPILAENPGHEAAQRIASGIVDKQVRIDQAKASQANAQSILRKPVTLQFRDANLRMVFEALSRTTGLNVILDRDVRADLKTTIFVKDASVEDTVDLILLQNQLDKRTLNASTLFVYPATPAKQKEYQDLQVRTFQIANAEAKYLQTVLKSLLKLKDSSVDERTNTIVVRDTPDALAVAAKVILASDVPEPEVMLEVEVLEISRSRASNIGLQLPTSFGVATPLSANTIGALRALTRNDLSATGLSATLNLQLDDSDTNLLASPRIRARHKEKAKILIGDRVPTIINSVTPIQSGGSVVTGSVQYQEVGLKLEFEPQIYNSSEVGIKLHLEVSNIANTFVDPQGGRSYQIGTRSAQTSLRLRDGETQVLGGLISDQDRNTASKIPGVGHLPVVGSLFGNNNMSRTKTEIVLSITPRIIRAPANIEAALRDIFSGTENSIRERALRLDAVADFRGGSATTAAKPAATPAPTARSGRPAAAAGQGAPDAAAGAADDRQAAPPANADGEALRPGPAATPADTPAASPAPASTPPASTAALPPAMATPSPAPATGAAATTLPGGDFSWAGPASARVGETIKVTLNAMALPAMRDMPLTVRFDPNALRFESASLGSLAKGAGASEPAPTVDGRKGRLDLPLTFSQPKGMSGDGAIIELTFTVQKGRNATQLVLAQHPASGTESGGRILLPGPRSLALRIVQ